MQGFWIFDKASKQFNKAFLLNTNNNLGSNKLLTMKEKLQTYHNAYTAKLLFHQSPTRHSDYMVTGQ